jgi:hypothetical protein
VPPNEGVDWSKWQKELGNKALPDNFNVFPINMDGHDDDYLLMVTKDNCPAYKDQLDATKSQITALNEKYKAFI